MENTEYLDFDDAVQFLKTTPSTLYKWLQGGKIPGHKLGRQWRFLKDELEIHISGTGSRINVQKDFLNLRRILSTRSTHKESDVNTNPGSIVEALIWDAFDHNARTLHIYPSKGRYEVSYRSNSEMAVLTTLQEDSFQELDQALTKISNSMDEGVSRRIYLHRNDEDVLQVRYQKLETVAGPRLTLRLWQPEKDVLPLEKITPDPNVIRVFKTWLTKQSGLILVTGISGSGKTTTIYSLINEYKNKGKLVFTVEESAEMVIEGVNQVEIKGSKYGDFEETFERVYLSDPDVICLGLGSYQGLEDQIYNAAYKAASTGHIVILQMDQPSGVAALNTFKKYVNRPVDHLIVGCVSQRLVEEDGKISPIYDFIG